MIVIVYKANPTAPVQRIATRTRKDADELIESLGFIRFRLWDNGWYHTAAAAFGDTDLTMATIEGPAEIMVYQR